MRVTVIVHPNSKKPRIEEDLLKMLNVYVNAPPLEGKANNATIESLANHFGTKKGNIVLFGGEKSKIKIFEIY